MKLRHRHVNRRLFKYCFMLWRWRVCKHKCYLVHGLAGSMTKAHKTNCGQAHTLNNNRDRISTVSIRSFMKVSSNQLSQSDLKPLIATHIKVKGQLKRVKALIKYMLFNHSWGNLYIFICGVSETKQSLLVAVLATGGLQMLSYSRGEVSVNVLDVSIY